MENLRKAVMGRRGNKCSRYLNDGKMPTRLSWMAGATGPSKWDILDEYHE